MTVDQSERVFDITILADLSRAGDIGLRIRQDIQTFQEIGYRVGLKHLPGAGNRKRILPDLRRSVRDGSVELIPPGAPFTAKLVVVYGPGLLKAPVTDLAGCNVDRVVLVLDRAPKLDQIGLWFSFSAGHVSWAPTNRWIRAKLLELGFPVEIEAEDWRPSARPLAHRPERPLARSRTVIGRVSAPGAAQWPQSPEELSKIYPTDPAIDFRTVGSFPSDLFKKAKGTSQWACIASDNIAVERFLETLDAYFFFPGALTPELNEAAISTAMASGIPVVLPPHLAPHFGPGPLYVEPEHALDETLRVLDDKEARTALVEAAKESAALRFGADIHKERLHRLIGPPAAKAASVKPARKSQKPRALFVPSNGVGLGHVTRLLAVARRLQDHVEPVFLTLAQANSVVRKFGYHSEYVPSHSDIGASLGDWDHWFAYELESVLDRHRPEVVVFDGNNPTHGLLRAVESRGDTRLVWIRRGMGLATPSPYLENSRFFDAIIEPGELAADYDTGPTATRRHEAIQVAPICLLDKAELAPRPDARKSLGLDEHKPAVLVQLGAGSTRDLGELIDRVVALLQRFEDLQIVIAEWSNSAERVPHIPGTKILRGFPNALYYHAFDFSIAASGYNTFHEVTSFGLPTIFVANRHPSMDDQGARAAFAQDNSLGFDLDEDEIPLLPKLVEALLTDQVNAFMRAKCAEFGGVNGAAEAANAIRRLVEAS